MIERLGARLTAWTRRYMPAPFTLAVLLTLVSLALGLAVTGGDALAVLTAWTDGPPGLAGFWNLLAFGMQMCLILVTGHALASSPPARRALDALAERPRTGGGAVALVAVVAMALALVNWGLGLIGGALLARRVGERARERELPVHHPLLAAAGYAGLLVWHGGLSGSAPLKVSRHEDLAEIVGEPLATRVGAMPLELTTLAPANLVCNLVLIVAVPWLLARMQPPPERRQPPPEAAPTPEPPPRDATPAARLDRSRALSWLLAAIGLLAWVLLMRRQGLGRLDPNAVNFVFLFVGIALHGSVRAYANAVAEGARGCAGIILQFPFYAGIMGVLAGTGLSTAWTQILSAAGPEALPAVSFYAGGLVNLFVPSGGGQWAVQGPVLMEAAASSGIAPERLVMALAYGDQWTNMLQPFWALPLLAITEARAQDVIGYTAVLLLASQIPFLGALYLGW